MLALLLACTIPAFTWAKGQWIWFRCFTLVFWIFMNTLLPEVLVHPPDIFNFATMDPRENTAMTRTSTSSSTASPKTPAQLGFEPDLTTPPSDGYRACMPWWREEDRRHPAKRGADLRS